MKTLLTTVLIVLCAASASARRAGTHFYVIPGHPNASDGTQYFCTTRSACGFDVDRIAQNYGERNQPFGSLREGVYQVQAFAAANSLQTPYTIHVAPGVYREHVYMNAHHDLRIVADTLGIFTASTPGEVVVTGAEPLDERAFEAEGTPNVWKLVNALGSDGLSICKTDRPVGMDCTIKTIFEVGNSDPHLSRLAYTEVASIADVALGPGRFFADIDQASPDYPVTLYVRTHDTIEPTPSLQLEYLLSMLPSNLYEGFYRYRHCFDMEGDAQGNTIEGFTCRNINSYGIHLNSGSNTVRGNRIHGSTIGVRIGTTAGASTARIVGNEMSHSVSGIHVEQADQNTVIENNVFHHCGSAGVRIGVAAVGATAVVFLGNNTLHANFNNLTVTGEAGLVALNNSLSDPVLNHYTISTTGGGGMSHNNLSGPGGTSVAAPGFLVTNQTTDVVAFRDAARFDLHLPPGSPLIDAGTSRRVAPNTPFEYRAPRSDGDFVARVAPPDIGAFEFSTVGDGVVDVAAGEQCDDGNRRAGDGCDPAGQIEPLYVFQGPVYATDSNCDCVSTLDNTGTKTTLDPLNAATPVSMAVSLNSWVVMVDNTTSSLLIYNPTTRRLRTQCSGLPQILSLAVSPVELAHPTRVFPAGTLFGADRHLFAINPGNCRTLDLGPIGPLGTEVIGGLDFRADGRLFGAELTGFGQPESLYRLDVTTGQFTAVGSIGPGADFVSGLVFDANGVLWASALAGANPTLFRVNPESGTVIHAIPVTAVPGPAALPQGLGVVRPPH